VVKKIMTSSHKEYFFSYDSSDQTLPIAVDTWWAFMKVGPKLSITQNYSQHAPSWHFYFNSRIAVTSYPSIICIICDQVLRPPSEHRTGLLVKQLLANAQIAKLDEST
jgi:hypothetical protein